MNRGPMSAAIESRVRVGPLFNPQQLPGISRVQLWPHHGQEIGLGEEIKTSGFTASIPYYDGFAAAGAVFNSLELSLPHRNIKVRG
jgi:hypothetical protein